MPSRSLPPWACSALLSGSLLLGGTACEADGGREAGTDAAVDAEAYPERPIDIVSWVTPGSPTDLLARALARVGERHFGQRINVVNRPGGGGATAMNHILSRPADGYTLGIMTSSGAITMAAGHIPFEAEDFTYIERFQLDPFLIAVSAESPFRDLNEMFDHARERPGELSVSGFGVTSAHFLAFARLRAEAGDPDIRWIPYEGTADAAVAVLGGHVDATNSNYNIVRENLRAGTMRVLGVSRGLPVLPDVSSYRDQGYDVEAMHWRGVMGPGGMPDALVERIHALFLATVEDPEFLRFIEESATELGVMGDPHEFHDWVLGEVRWSRERLAEMGLLQERGRR